MKVKLLLRKQKLIMQLKLLKQYLQKMKTHCLLQMLMMKFVVMKNTTWKLTQVKLLPVFNAKWNTILTTMWKG